MDTSAVYVDENGRQRWQALMEAEGLVRDFETRFYRPDGTIWWASDTARAVRDETGHVLYYEGSVEDITERKRFQEEVQRQKDYFEALFVNSPIAVAVSDLNGVIVSWNPMAEKLFGYAQEGAVGRPLDDVVAADPLIREQAARYTHQAVSYTHLTLPTN